MSLISGSLRNLFLAALLLRAGLALVTEFHPLLPEYYYTDAHHMEELASDILKARAQGRWYVPGVSPPKRVQAMATAMVYRVTGPRPLAVKLLQAAIGALAVLAFYHLAACAAGPGPALAAAAVMAVWPTNVFITSQNFKDGPVALCVFAALALLARAMSLERGRDLARALVLAFVALIAVGFQRAYVMAVLAAVAAPIGAAAAALRWRQGRPARAALLAGATALAAPFAYQALARYVFNGPLAPSNSGRQELNILPITHDPKSDRLVSPLSPRRLSETRRIRQVSDQAWAHLYKGRRIGTQLFYGVEFNTWWDVAAFLPKGMFYALFMPLPGLYPLEGSLGRFIASLENVALLGLACLGLAGALRGAWTPERLLILGVFSAMAVGSGLLEFDLGSATRHRILYLPLLFPFASLPVARRRGAGRPKW